MFVSVALDPGSEERAKSLADLLARYGYDKVQRGLWESSTVTQASLDRLKRDLDRLTDAYDRTRIYQYPVDGTMVISSLKDKKWRKIIARPPLKG